MIVTTHVKEAHQALSQTNVKFLDFVQKRPEFLKRSRFPELVNWSNAASEVKLQPWPLFIDKSTAAEFREASVKVFGLIKSIPRRIFSLDPGRMSTYYNLPLEQVKQALYGFSDEYAGGLLARGDFLMPAAGLKCIEFNITSSLGGMQLPFWEALSLRNPLIAEFINSHQLKITNKNVISLLIEHLTGISQEYFPGEDEINIVFVVHSPEILAIVASQAEYINRLYKNSLKGGKGDVVFCTLNQLEIAGHHVYYNNKRIHIILDNNETNIPPEISILFKMRNVLIYNGPISQIMSSKLNIALLSEHEDSELFSPVERKAIKKYIPWTRKMTRGTTVYDGKEINLWDFVIAGREKLVLKEAEGYGGVAVHLGWNATVVEWEGLVSKAFRQGHWVVQERITSRPLLFQCGEEGCTGHDNTWGIFVFGSRYCGVWLRALPGESGEKIINVHQGAQVPIVFQVDE